MDRHIYDDILDEFELHHPNIARNVVSWHPSGRREITVKLNDGNRVVFDDALKTIRYISNHSDPLLEEDSWKTGFGRKLGQALFNKGLTQNVLSERTGISQVMISRYISGKTMPSAYATAKIARALECSIHELTDFE